MQVYEITLKGYRADTDATDYLIKWVKADSEGEVNQWLRLTGLLDCVEEVLPLLSKKPMGLDDGIDVIIHNPNPIPTAGRTWPEGEDDSQVEEWKKQSKTAQSWREYTVTYEARFKKKIVATMQDDLQDVACDIEPGEGEYIEDSFELCQIVDEEDQMDVLP